MKPKDGFVKGPHKGFLMHVTKSKASMVNPSRIGSCDQKDAISDSETGADSSLGMPAAAADPMSESADIECDLRPSRLPPNSSSPSLSIPPELFQSWPSMQQYYGMYGLQQRTL